MRSVAAAGGGSGDCIRTRREEIDEDRSRRPGMAGHAITDASCHGFD
jgi:hypothetical protein